MADMMRARILRSPAAARNAATSDQLRADPAVLFRHLAVSIRTGMA